MTLGALARYFKTPIPFFLDQTPPALDEWVEVMNEMIRREEDEMRKATRAQGG